MSTENETNTHADSDSVKAIIRELTDNEEEHKEWDSFIESSPCTGHMNIVTDDNGRLMFIGTTHIINPDGTKGYRHTVWCPSSDKLAEMIHFLLGIEDILTASRMLSRAPIVHPKIIQS